MSDRFNSMGAFSRTMAAPVRPTTSESAPTERGAGRQDEAITTGASKPISVDSRSLSRRALDGTAGFHAAEEISSEGFPPRLLGAIIGLALIIAIIGYLIESAPSKKELSDSLKFRSGGRQSSGASFSGSSYRAVENPGRKSSK